jgi:hypothetical protein
VSRRITLPIAIVAAALLTAGCSGGSSPRPGASTAPVFSFGMFGDMPYSDAEARAIPGLIDQMNSTNLAFTVFVGDIQGGGRCDNALYTGTVDEFNSFRAPLVYTPGDNEWTDCHQTGQDPIERLGHIRQTMFRSPQSFGQRTIALDEQRPQFPENARWRMGSVLFLTINVPGSNNNHIADPDADEDGTARTAADRRAAESEYEVRDQADRDWLHQGFVEAATTHADAVVVLMQADPGFDVAPDQRAARHLDGYDKLLGAFVGEAKAFGKPVLIGHGDSHRLQFDQPLLDPSSRQIVPNVWRAESFGSPDVGWVRITVDVHNPKPFTLEDDFVARG